MLFRSLRRAEQCYKRAERLDPNDSSAHAHLGSLYANKGDRARALGELKVADRLSSEQQINTEQSLCLAYSALHELPAAIHHCKVFLALATQRRLNPDAVLEFKDKLRDLQARLSPIFVDAQRPNDYSAQALDFAIHARLSNSEIEQIVDRKSVV